MSKKYTWRVAAKVRYYADRKGIVIPFKLGAADTSQKYKLHEIPLVSKDFSTYWLNRSKAQGLEYFQSAFMEDVQRIAAEQGIEDVFATDDEQGFMLYDLWIENGRVGPLEEREVSS